MIYRHIYTPIALVEYKEAVSWYAARSVQAAENFVKAIKERIDLICEKPLRYRNGYKNFRETSLKKYPFYIIYFTDESKKTVIIAPVYHHKRNPAKKYVK
jgi:plasmid stabilization system protein ParE